MVHGPHQKTKTVLAMVAGPEEDSDEDTEEDEENPENLILMDRSVILPCEDSL